jgi:hypothetical protein
VPSPKTSTAPLSLPCPDPALLVLGRVGGTAASPSSRCSGPRINRWRGPITCRCRPPTPWPTPSRTSAFFAHRQERSTRSGHESSHCRWQPGQRHGALAILPHVDAGHADLGDLSRRCLVRASAVRPVSPWSAVVSLLPAYVSHPAAASAIFPPYDTRSAPSRAPICRSRARSFCIGDRAGGVRSQRAIGTRNRPGRLLLNYRTN